MHARKYHNCFFKLVAIYVACITFVNYIFLIYENHIMYEIFEKLIKNDTTEDKYIKFHDLKIREF